MNKKRLKEYRAWKAMKARCNAPCNKETSYQERGIAVCKEWSDSYDAFYRDMGSCPSPDSTLDRIDNSKGYCKDNCRWTNRKTQSSNRGEFNKVFTFNGESKILKDWARHFDINYTTLYQRIYRGGLSFEDAIKIDPYKRLITIGDKAMNLKNWCLYYGRKYSTVVNRIHDGMDTIAAILMETPK